MTIDPTGFIDCGNSPTFGRDLHKGLRLNPREMLMDLGEVMLWTQAESPHSPKPSETLGGKVHTFALRESRRAFMPSSRFRSCNLRLTSKVPASTRQAYRIQTRLKVPHGSMLWMAPGCVTGGRSMTVNFIPFRATSLRDGLGGLAMALCRR